MLQEMALNIGVEALRYTLYVGAAYNGWRLIQSYRVGADVEKVKEAFYNCRLRNPEKRIPALIGRKKEAEGVYLYTWRIPDGLALSDFIRRKEDLETALDAEVQVWIKSGFLHTKIAYNEIPDFLPFSQRPDIRGLELGFSVGVSREGPEAIDLGNPISPHLLIAGATGSGKSVLLRQGIVSMMLTYGPDKLVLYGVDLKGGVELAEFSEAKHTRFIATNLEDTATLLQELNGELNSRLAMLREHGLKNWRELREKMPSLPYILVVMDEFADLNPNEAATKDEKEIRKVCHAGTSRLLRLARAAGIHVIICTQRPDHHVIPGQLKANMDATICLKMKDNVNSEIVLKNDLAAHLPPIPGRAVYQFDRDKIVQVPFLSSKKALRLLRSHGIM